MFRIKLKKLKKTKDFKMRLRKEAESKQDINRRGYRGELCYSLGCSNSNSFWYHRLEGQYHCQSCAIRINEASQDLDEIYRVLGKAQEPIVALLIEDLESWKKSILVDRRGYKYAPSR